MKILPISILVLSTVILLPTVNSKNILYLAWPAYSHLNSMISIANELAKYGHNNYFILDRNYTKTFQNQQSINILPMDEIPEMELMRFDAQKQEKSKQIYVMRQLLNTFPMICDRFLRNEKWIESLRAVNASLAVINGIFMTNCLTIIPYQLSIPFVLTASEIYPSLHRIPWLPTVFPNSMLTSSDKMTYSEKLISTLAAILDYTIPPIGAPTHSVKTYAKDKPDISFTDLLHQAQFFLIEKDVLLDYPLPQLPNVRYVGGLAAKRSISLKGELLKFVNASTNGIVVVSFGSNINDFPAVQLEKLQSALKQIKYDVVWRQKKTSFSHKNIYISDWVPQNDLLGHPKTKLFVTHCGNSGQFEALVHGVPMLGIPLFADQHYNSRRMTEKGYGLSLDIENFTPGELIEKIKELIENKTYSEKIKRASEIFHSRPEYPAKKSARHIDHILKYGGEYLKSPCQESQLYEFFMIDVLAPIFAVT
ncbi:UDP-glucuronosyltransferase 2A2 [Octopus bimaculoides]|uniref:UDP-glucuronosyltransferase n=1 Tax=Octopus bimaculoides TaxID=37653 RepID=A0A0L8GWW2_OCTBM|nr:UDP-glucuronosyltransferase 2A2 [Octopus bimaculoides]|eukprot:XP_014777408.1 PREDICTED: UDP-glucuronosyltransferase 2A1-like [Octopus bimaculoides]